MLPQFFTRDFDNLYKGKKVGGIRKKSRNFIRDTGNLKSGEHPCCIQNQTEPKSGSGFNALELHSEL